MRPTRRGYLATAATGLTGLLLAGCAAVAGPTPSVVPSAAPSRAPTSAALASPSPRPPSTPTPTPAPCYTTEDLTALPFDIVAQWDVVCYLPPSGPTTMIDQIGAAVLIRAFLEDPGRAVAFREITFMANSPGGRLRVERFVDDRGNGYLIAPLAHKLLEMDPGVVPPSTGATLSDDELRARAEALIRREFPGWDSLRDRLTDRSGEKAGGLHFFRWESEVALKGPGGLPPLVQVGITAAGEVFSYINTLYTLE